VRLSCSESQALWERYATEKLESDERSAVREHLAGCRECLNHAAAADASLLFAGVPTEPVSADEIQTVLAGVRAGIAWKQTERRLARRPMRTWASVAALAAVMLLLPGNRERREPAAAAAKVSGSNSVTEYPALPAASPAEGTGLGKTLPAGATIYDWGMGSEQPRVVWIVDRSLDI
jgi:putative zinc finger protein